MYPRFTPEEWERQNFYAYSRGISPPRNRHEEPRPGYYPHDYRSVSPRSYSMELRRRPRVNSLRQPRMHASLSDGYAFAEHGLTMNMMPGWDWCESEDEMEYRGRR
jgi:hypothetical protein